MSINIRLFDLIKDKESIASFLKNRAVAHKLDHLESESWFRWKFYQSPYSPSIMCCVFDDKNVVGCNSYGHYVLVKNKIKIKTIMPYEAFVLDDYQGKGLFKKLIEMSELEAENHKIEVRLIY